MLRLAPGGNFLDHVNNLPTLRCGIHKIARHSASAAAACFETQKPHLVEPLPVGELRLKGGDVRRCVAGGGQRLLSAPRPRRLHVQLLL